MNGNTGDRAVATVPIKKRSKNVFLDRMIKTKASVAKSAQNSDSDDDSSLHDSESDINNNRIKDHDDDVSSDDDSSDSDIGKGKVTRQINGGSSDDDSSSDDDDDDDNDDDDDEKLEEELGKAGLLNNQGKANNERYRMVLLDYIEQSISKRRSHFF